MPTKGEGEDGNSACHEHQIVPSTLLFDKVHIQRGSCWLSCEILASIATIACGNNGWVPSLSLIKATWERQAPPLLRLRCPLVWLLRRKLPLPLPPWNKDTKVSSKLMQSGCSPAGTRAAQLSYNCQTAWAWFCNLGIRKRDRFWSRNLSSKTVSLSEPHVRFLS